MIFVVPQVRGGLQGHLGRRTARDHADDADGLASSSSARTASSVLRHGLHLHLHPADGRGLPRGQLTRRAALLRPGEAGACRSSGTLTRKIIVARFTRTLGTLIASGVPILEALNICRDTVGQRGPRARRSTRCTTSIREGESIAEPLGETGIFDDIVVNMIDVGEETGELDKMLIKVADNYDEEVDVAVGLPRERASSRCSSCSWAARCSSSSSASSCRS